MTDLPRWWDAGETVGVGTVVGTWKSVAAPARRRRCSSAPTAPRSAASPAAASRARSTSWPRRPRDDRHAGAAALRRQRRRRVRGRADLRRHHRHLRRAGRPATFPEFGDGRRRHRAPAARSPSPRSSAGRTRAARARGWSCARTRVERHRSAAQRLDDAVRDDVAGLLAQGSTGDRALRPRRRAARRRHRGLRRLLRPAAADDRVRRDRLRRRRRPGRRRSSATGSRSATRGRPSRRTKRFPDADEVVVEWPHRYLAEHRGRRAHRASACSPTTRSSTCRCSRSRCGCRWPTSARWARGAPTTTAAPGCASSASTDDELARLHAPIGLDVGGRTPEETAVSIAAEIIAAPLGRHRRAAAAGIDGPIHREYGAPAARRDAASARCTQAS